MFGGFLPGLNDDPFFRGHMSAMRQMDDMMSSMLRDPFGNSPFLSRGHSMPSILGPSISQALVVRDPFSGFSPVPNIMTSMDQMARDGNCHSYSSSTVMAMTTGPDGNPQVYKATSSSNGLPGGVRETHKTVADSRTGVKKMAIGHHIGDRSHVVEREQNQIGDMEERQEFVNLEEDDAAAFNSEFRRRSNQFSGRSLDYVQNHAHRSSPYSSEQRPRPLAITDGHSDNRTRRRERHHRPGGARRQV